jgi:CRISPR-associated endonuclease/helicase Cas3
MDSATDGSYGHAREVDAFARDFRHLTGHPPFRWQQRLYDRFVIGDLPTALDLPTGLGKTSVMAIWLVASAFTPQLPRRLVYVVDRRTVVDQATAEAEKLCHRLSDRAELAGLRSALGLSAGARLPLSTLRGQLADNHAWLEDPTQPAIIIGTIDMIGSRLLFEGYGVSRGMRPYQAGLLGADTLVVLDEAHLSAVPGTAVGHRDR